jgi:hypothetical protein
MYPKTVGGDLVMKKGTWSAFLLMMTLFVLVGCSQPATVTVVETVEVPVETVIEKEVITTVEVEKVVEKEVMVEGGERGQGGTLNLIYWQAVSIINPYLSTGTKDFHAGSLVLEPLAEFDEVA